MKKCPFYRGECDEDVCTLWKQYGSSYDRVEDPCLFVVWLCVRADGSATPLATGEA